MTAIVVGKTPMGLITGCCLTRRGVAWIGISESHSEEIGRCPLEYPLFSLESITTIEQLLGRSTVTEHDIAMEARDQLLGLPKPSKTVPSSSSRVFTLGRELPEIQADQWASAAGHFRQTARISLIESGSIVFTDGQSFDYNQIFWCSDALRLADVSGLRLSKKNLTKPLDSTSAIEIVCAPNLRHNNTPLVAVVGFKHKGYHLQALYFSHGATTSTHLVKTASSFLVGVPSDIEGSAEEQAKLIRSIKREVVNTAFDTTPHYERIIHHRISPLATPHVTDSVAFGPQAYYCGHELTAPTPPREARYFEVAARNIESALRESGIFGLSPSKHIENSAPRM